MVEENVWIIIMAKRFNFKTKGYEPYTPPKYSEITRPPLPKNHPSLHKDLIQCACCGRFIIVESSYTSLAIKDESLENGYMICSTCYLKENTTWE